jgi:hypothetical protein
MQLNIIFFIILILIISLFLNYYKNKKCPKCKKNFALLKISSNSKDQSIEKLYPSKFKYKQYYINYKCKYCGYIKKNLILQTKNKYGKFD